VTDGAVASCRLEWQCLGDTQPTVGAKWKKRERRTT
jgi:hypothetical protein